MRLDEEYSQMNKKAALYLRVSTGQQTTRNQRIALVKSAKSAGWEIVQVYEDAAISGSKGRDKRPAFDAMCKDAARREFDVIMSWSVDRLGRSLQDLVGFLGDIHASGVDLYLHQQALDTTTPTGRAMFGMLGVFAEFERAMIRERVNAGLQRAREQGKTLGRPKVLTDKLLRFIRKEYEKGLSQRQIAAKFKVSKGTVAKALA